MTESTLLVVDDEKAIISALKRLLRKESYHLLTAGCGREALEMLEERPVQVVVSDYRMPGMSGAELLREVRRRYPDTVRVVLSGYADAAAVVDSINFGEVYRFMPKPWNDDELIVSFRQCFERYRLLEQNRDLLDRVQRQNDELKRMNDLLELAVRHRTRSLELSQEMLEKLPVPVLGVNPDGMIVLVNSAVGRVVRSGAPMPIGVPLAAFFPEEVVEMVRHSLQERLEGTVERCTLNGRDFRVLISLLQEGRRLRGCTLILEAIHDNDYSFSFGTDSAAN